MLRAAFWDIVKHWRAVFPQERTARRAIPQALGHPRRAAPQLGRRISAAFWLSLGTPAVVRADSGAVLPRPPGGSGGG